MSRTGETSGTNDLREVVSGGTSAGIWSSGRRRRRIHLFVAFGLDLDSQKVSCVYYTRRDSGHIGWPDARSQYGGNSFLHFLVRTV